MSIITADFEIRTMKSDIEDIKSGGGNLELINQSKEEINSGTAGEDEPNNSSPVKIAVILISLIIILAGIGFLTYYVALKLLNK